MAMKESANMPSKRAVSRRQLLKRGAAALGGGSALLGGPAMTAQSTQAPSVLTGTQTGRTFRGLVRHDTTLDIQELRLLAIDPRQVVIRSQAVAPCLPAGRAERRFGPGCDVVVFGAGPVGVGAIQAGRVTGAGQIIAIDPIKYRREFALKMGATLALDPVAEGDGLVERVREIC